jgi:DNA-binding Xre family transcriptional regulator
MTVGKNVKVNGYLIFSKIVDQYKHLYSFCEQHNISYQTINNIVYGKTKALRAETLIQVAAALYCSPQDLALEPLVKEPKAPKKLNKYEENLNALLAELNLIEEAEVR